MALIKQLYFGEESPRVLENERQEMLRQMVSNELVVIENIDHADIMLYANMGLVRKLRDDVWARLVEVGRVFDFRTLEYDKCANLIRYTISECGHAYLCGFFMTFEVIEGLPPAMTYGKKKSA